MKPSLFNLFRLVLVATLLVFGGLSATAASSGITFVEHNITTGFNLASAVYAIDLDADGDQDVIGGSRTALGLGWWENDGNENFTKHTIAGADFETGFITAYDVDHDNDIDIAAAENGTPYELAWWENNGSEVFTKHRIRSGPEGYPGLVQTDLDDDGNIDLVSPLQATYASDRGLLLVWWQNNGSGIFTERTLVSPSFLFTASGISVVDLDGDADKDILVSSWPEDTMIWYRNDGNENFTGQVIGPSSTVYAADMEGDGDVDILGASDVHDCVAWWENDGSENFSEHCVIAGSDGRNIVQAVDLDGDLDLDVIGTDVVGDMITWWENDGSQNYSAHLIGSVGDPSSLVTIDLDDDADLDVLVAAWQGNLINWWEQERINLAPSVEAGGPYDVPEGGSITVTASGSDPEGSLLNFAWDLDHNGSFETPGQTVTFSAADLEGPSRHTITVRVTDSEGLSATDQTTVVVLDVTPLYLHGTGSSNNPPTLFLDDTVPTATTAKYRDSTSVKFSGGNLWKEIGSWIAASESSAGILSDLNDLHIWLGLKNSDDQGTNFDLRVEVYHGDTLVASGETYCIAGITRNAVLAQEVDVAFGTFLPVVFDGVTDVLSLKALTRIGTDGAGGFCGGHSNAVGLRAYFDAVDRSSGFDAIFGP